MKCFKGLLRKIDVFGVPYSFNNKKDEYFKTSLGGFIFILFVVVVFVLGIYYFIPFFNRKNLSIIYYTTNMAGTDTIKLEESKANLAIGLACPFNEKTQVSGKDLFDLQLTYIIYKTNSEGIKNKIKTRLSSHQCTYADFYNNYNETFDFMSLNQFECLDKKDDSLKGIYTDEIFSYYEFSLVSKNDSIELFSKIDSYLTEQDCRLELYYTDIIMDIDNYKEPIKPYINSVFLQLNPSLFSKMNVYFKYQHFINDNFLLFVFDDEEEKTKHTLFSRFEDYSLYKGLDRGVTQPNDNIKYANIYIRSDTSKTVIKRKYQKVMEFYADSSSLLIALFELLYIIFCFVNKFYAYHSLAKHIFIFKEAENKYFDINRKSYQIKNLIRLLEPLLEKKNNFPNINKNNIRTTKNNEEKNNIELHYLKDGIEIYDENKIERSKESNSKADEIFNINDFRKLYNKRLRNTMIRRAKFSKDEDYKENNKNLSTIQTTNRNLINRHKIKSSKISNMSNKESKENELAKMGRIKFKYNIFEIFWSYLWKCCMSNKLKIKKNLTEKSNNILYNKLDISLYIKNAILIDILNRILVQDNIKSMTKFISRPMISLSKNGEKDMNQFYINDKVINFDNLSEVIREMNKKPKLTQAEKKIIFLVYKELKEIV